MIESTLAQLGLLTLGIWTLTEMLHRIPWVKSRIGTPFLALIIGVIGGVVLPMSGFFMKPPDTSQVWFVAGMVFLSLIAVATAGTAHDKLIRAVKEPLKK